MASRTTVLGLHRPAPGHEETANARHNDNADIIAAKLGTTLHAVRLGVDLATGQRLAWVPPHNVTITGVSIVSQTATTGSDGSNKYVVTLQNLTKAEAVATLNTDTGDELAADDETALVLGATTVRDIDAGDVLEFQATKTGAPTSLAAADILLLIRYTIDA